MNRRIVEKSYPVDDSQGNRYTIDFVRPGAAGVYLVTHTGRPIQTMAITTRGYTGVYRSVIDNTDIQPLLDDIVKTKLQTPFEMVHTLWLLRNVSRAFTHQLVRYRIGTSFVQESMRFLGKQGAYQVLNTVGDEDHILRYHMAALSGVQNYHELVLAGVPSQDARGVLPTNILTQLFFSCSLRTIQNIIPQRLCCQAQPGEWQLVVKEMRRAIGAQMGKQISDMLRAPYELGQDCGYRASFDRPCIWQKEDNGEPKD
jgi:thymidylate synthase ThyX